MYTRDETREVVDPDREPRQDTLIGLELLARGEFLNTPARPGKK